MYKDIIPLIFFRQIEGLRIINTTNIWNRINWNNIRMKYGIFKVEAKKN